VLSALCRHSGKETFESATRSYSSTSIFDLAEHDPAVGGPSPISALSVDCSSEVDKIGGERDVGDMTDCARKRSAL
jgi:hypothetical protein